MAHEQKNNPLHGITLEKIVTSLVDYYGWAALSNQIDINCFKSNPSIRSSLKFLRKTPWAREKVEALYLTISNYVQVIKSLYLFFTALALIYVTKFDSYGLYLFIAIVWIIAGFIEKIQRPAIWSIIIFMSGFAVMRLVNIAINGLPSSFYLAMFISELIIILIGIKLIK